MKSYVISATECHHFRFLSSHGSVAFRICLGFVPAVNSNSSSAFIQSFGICPVPFSPRDSIQPYDLVNELGQSRIGSVVGQA